MLSILSMMYEEVTNPMNRCGNLDDVNESVSVSERETLKKIYAFKDPQQTRKNNGNMRRSY